MKALTNILAASAFAGLGLASSAHAGTTYLFTVTCPESAQVVEWGVGDIDPGKEFLRVSTGTHYPGCSVTDFHDADARLPRIRYSHEEAFWQGIPPIGSILNALFR